MAGGPMYANDIHGFLWIEKQFIIFPAKEKQREENSMRERERSRFKWKSRFK